MSLNIIALSAGLRSSTARLFTEFKSHLIVRGSHEDWVSFTAEAAPDYFNEEEMKSLPMPGRDFSCEPAGMPQHCCVGAFRWVHTRVRVLCGCVDVRHPLTHKHSIAQEPCASTSSPPSPGHLHTASVAGPITAVSPIHTHAHASPMYTLHACPIPQ